MSRPPVDKPQRRLLWMSSFFVLVQFLMPLLMTGLIKATLNSPPHRMLADLEHAPLDPHGEIHPYSTDEHLEGASPPLPHSFPAGARPLWPPALPSERHSIVPPPPSDLILGLLVSLVVQSLMAVLFARTLSLPLKALAQAAERLGSGELNARLNWQRRDEFGAVASAFDEMAERIVQLLRTEQEMLANISHELRSPLARIRVALDIAEEGDPETARQSLQEISTDLESLEKLVDDVLTSTRLSLSSGKIGLKSPPMHVEPLQVGPFLLQTAHHFRMLYPSRTLTVKIPDTLPTLTGDPALLRRVVNNLLDNAHKYSEQSSPIQLEVRINPPWLELWVIDEGIGIEPDDLSMLTTPFFRTDRSRTRTSGGVGLGLTLARRIVEAHRGTLTFESQAGLGTRVCVALPISAPAIPSQTLP